MCVCAGTVSERWKMEVSRTKYLVLAAQVWGQVMGGRGSCSHSSRYMCFGGGGADIEQEGSIRKHPRIPDDLVLLAIQSTSRRGLWPGTGASTDGKGHLPGLVYALGKQRSSRHLGSICFSPGQRNCPQDRLTHPPVTLRSRAVAAV